MTEITSILGGVGTGLIILAYIPQIKHIIKEHCSGGMSKGAWSIWLIAGILLLIHAVNIKDTVFTALQLANILAIGSITILILIYNPRVCHSKENNPGKTKIGKKRKVRHK